MSLSMNLKKAVLGCGIVLGLSTLGCSRDHIEAVNLTNEGDRAVKVNPSGAIQKYEQAIQLDPTNSIIVGKLARAYEKQEDWDKMASTLSKATTLAPEFANFWEKQGLAYTKQAEAGDKDAWEEAKKPLETCIKTDPNRAWCYQLLGEAQWWTDDIEGALKSFTQAIEHDPRISYFYVTLAELYQVLRMYDQAGQVLEQGIKNIERTEENRDSLYNLSVLQFSIAQFAGDTAKMLRAVKEANQLGGDDHPEAKFNLGSTYAKLDPPDKDNAKRYLESFVKRSCKGASLKKFKAQCGQANSIIQTLGI
jgi:tetratricopeptide (TPR) repeat protein